MIAHSVLDRQRGAAGDQSRLVERQIGRRIVEELMPPALRLEQQGERGIAADIDAINGVHLTGDLERHALSSREVSWIRRSTLVLDEAVLRSHALAAAHSADGVAGAPAPAGRHPGRFHNLDMPGGARPTAPPRVRCGEPAGTSWRPLQLPSWAAAWPRRTRAAGHALRSDRPRQLSSDNAGLKSCIP